MCGGKPPSAKPTLADDVSARRVGSMMQFDQSVILPERYKMAANALDEGIDAAIKSHLTGRAAVDVAGGEKVGLAQRIVNAQQRGGGVGGGANVAGIDETLNAGSTARLEGLAAATNSGLEQRRNERVAMLASAAGNSGALTTSLAARARREQQLAMAKMEMDIETGKAWGNALMGAGMAGAMRVRSEMNKIQPDLTTNIDYDAYDYDAATSGNHPYQMYDRPDPRTMGYGYT